MIHSLKDTVQLNNGLEMPGFGLGVWKVKDGEEVIHSVRSALNAGYTMIDTAAIYRNEAGVGEALRQSAVQREDVFITTKVWNADQGYDTTLKAFETSTKKLGINTVDLYLIHWPTAGKYKETWRAMEKLYKDGRVRAIGVCNFHIHHLKDLMEGAEIKPAVNQIELHPLLSQVPLRNYCYKEGIAVEAYSPLGSGGLINHPLLSEIGKKYGKTAAQVMLRWDVDSEIITIPRSTKEAHIISNADIFDFELSPEDIDQIDTLNEDKRFGADPDNFNF
ncbi:aldo/keto reductase [Sporolactobacillus terrae]|uniref:Aldo/keto reductase n=1 Tax=Sporolactobacillus terrae TaxID=269673 RepID=A0A410D5Z6_9BACL|nr:aldo/keto reductase [Sporolactobacillus terrae]QAA24502.1 aldo/keto reductase [Sporolactobacillus terrae]BBN97816.1 oxidoreductase [Sporolactobacillus terrae]